MHQLKLKNDYKVLIGIGSLIQNYWKDENFKSKSQSSFWEYYSSFAKVEFNQQNGELKFEGTMFGDYKQTSINPLKRFLPANLITRYQLKGVAKPIRETVLTVCKRHNREVNFDCLKQALSVEKIIKSGVDLKNKKICIIGDGYGFLGCLLKCLEPSVKIVSVNLGKISVFDAGLTSFGFPEMNINFAGAKDEYRPNADFNFIPAEVVFECDVRDIDLFLNIASMQEMTKKTIDAYFSWMRTQKHHSKYFYCCNRVSKILPSGEKIEFSKFDWKSTDKIFFDETCEWYQKSPSNRPPFFKKFDGDVWHRLVKFQ